MSVAAHFPLPAAGAQLPAPALETAVEERLSRSSYLELRRIRGSIRDGVLILTGYVSSYYLRQVAQSLVRDLDGLDAIDNRIEVVPGRPVTR